MVAAVLAVTACSPTAARLGRATTVLLVTSGEDADGSVAQRTLASQIEERDDLAQSNLARLASLAAEDRESSTEAAELDAQRRIEQANDAFSRFEYGPATTQLGEALELLRPLASRASGRSRLAQVHLTLAMVLLVHGERDAALEELRTCLHLDPQCAPDPARHPPELVELHDQVRTRGSTHATLVVATTPPGALATLDGQREGETPITWQDVGVGHHYVTLRRDGFLPEVQVVSVAAGEPTERSFALSPGPPAMRASAALRALHRDGLDAEPRWREQAAHLSEADVLLVLQRSPERLALAAFDSHGGPLGDALERPAQEADVRAFLDDVLPPPTVPWFGQWWFWTPLAAGISIALASATFFAVNTPDVRILGGRVVLE